MFLAATGLTTHIFNNQLKSILLLAGFPVLLLLMIGGFFGAVNLVASGDGPLRNSVAAYSLISQASRGQEIAFAPHRASLDWAGAMAAAERGILRYGHWAFLFAGIWFVIAFFFHGGMMRMATGSQPVSRTAMPRVYNLLENLCISRGIPMPQLEVIDSPAMNAFATGLGENTYKIVLTRGIIDGLENDELEAVLGHELTHIMNRDVRLLVIAVIFVGMISFFTQLLFRMLVHGVRPNYYIRGREGRGGGIAIMIIAMAVLAIGYVFAIAIRFALSRKREYLADAGSVELTKNPDAMMRALQRIAGKDAMGAMPNEVEQMCIENSHDFMGIFATHPPIDDRIRAISQMTGTPIPELRVSLKRGPRSPWEEGLSDNSRTISVP